ncbi:hypothetical protein, partial [Humibacter antri]
MTALARLGPGVIRDVRHEALISQPGFTFHDVGTEKPNISYAAGWLNSGSDCRSRRINAPSGWTDSYFRAAYAGAASLCTSPTTCTRTS